MMQRQRWRSCISRMVKPACFMFLVSAGVQDSQSNCALENSLAGTVIVLRAADEVAALAAHKEQGKTERTRVIVV